MTGRPSVTKRQKEQQRAERAQEKSDKRKAKRDKPRPAGENGEDPDLAGIVPGPQPVDEANFA
jgi:hypothetical protein